jgi:hypothetical protein
VGAVNFRRPSVYPQRDDHPQTGDQCKGIWHVAGDKRWGGSDAVWRELLARANVAAAWRE